MTEPIEIFVEAPTRKAIGYACGVCGMTHLRQSSTDTSLRAAKACCWCSKHEIEHKRPEECPKCQKAIEALRNEARWKREAEILSKAVPWDPTMEGLLDEDRFYPSPDDYFEARADSIYPDKTDPDWIPLLEEATPVPILRAASIIEDANSELEGADDPIYKFPDSDAAVDELQAALDAWAEKHAPSRQWYMPGQWVRLDKELAEWLRENPDMVAGTEGASDESSSDERVRNAARAGGSR